MFPRSGNPISGVFVLEQARALAATRRDLRILIPIAESTPAYLRAIGSSERVEIARQFDGLTVREFSYPHVPLQLSTRFENISLGRQLLRVVSDELRHNPVDILHAPQFYPTGLAAVRAGELLGIPVVCTAHGSDVHTHPNRAVEVRPGGSKSPERGSLHGSRE